MAFLNITVTLAILLAYIFESIIATQLSQCQIAVQLQNLGFPKNQLNDWVCLVQHESEGITSAVGGPNSDSSYDYGLFQINSRYWCSKSSTAGNGCNLTCQNLLNADLTDDAKCALKIYGQSGFQAWSAWVTYCKNRSLPDVTHCLS